jgi:hypothetical protein
MTPQRQLNPLRLPAGDNLAAVSAFAPQLRAQIARELEWRRPARGSRRAHLARHQVPAQVREGGKLAHVVVNLPNRLPAMREEMALWRAFLSNEIDAIMHGEG